MLLLYTTYLKNGSYNFLTNFCEYIACALEMLFNRGDNMPLSTKFVLSFTALTALLITILMLLGFSFKPIAQQDTHILKSYKNTVALYTNGKFVKSYDNIVLNTLPQIDINSLNNGITVENDEEIDKILQDYDG